MKFNDQRGWKWTIIYFVNFQICWKKFWAKFEFTDRLSSQRANRERKRLCFSKDGRNFAGGETGQASGSEGAEANGAESIVRPDVEVVWVRAGFEVPILVEPVGNFKLCQILFRETDVVVVSARKYRKSKSKKWWMLWLSYLDLSFLFFCNLFFH